MSQGCGQLVHGPLAEIGVIREHLRHMQAVEVHLALPREANRQVCHLGPPQRQPCKEAEVQASANHTRQVSERANRQLDIHSRGAT